MICDDHNYDDDLEWDYDNDALSFCLFNEKLGF